MQKSSLHLQLLKLIAAAALGVAAVAPVGWLAVVAMSDSTVPLNRFPSPEQLTLANFSGAWSAGGLLRPLVNSIVVTLVQSALNVFLASLAAFPLARMNFRGRNLLFLIILATLMVPEQILVVPLFRTVIALNIYDTLAGVIIPFSVSALGIYLCRQAMTAIPPEMDEAAAIDGASSWQVYRHVMLPLSAPTLATLGIFSFIGAWSSLLWPLIVLQSQHHYTLPVALDHLTGMFASNIRYAYAGSVLALIPVITVYLVLQRWLHTGLMAGAVKQ